MHGFGIGGDGGENLAGAEPPGGVGFIVQGEVEQDAGRGGEGGRRLGELGR